MLPRFKLTTTLKKCKLLSLPAQAQYYTLKGPKKESTGLSEILDFLFMELVKTSAKTKQKLILQLVNLTL